MLISKLFNNKNMKNAWLMSVLFWNPVFTSVIVLAMGGSASFTSSWLESWFIATIVSQVCFAAVVGAQSLDAFFSRRRGQVRPPTRSRAWRLSVSMCAMPLGLYVSLNLTSFIYHLYGRPVYLPNFNDYKIGLIIGSLIAGFFFLINTRTEAREAACAAEMKLKTLENERLQAQIAALTAQMNPHLLFNALNTIASLVPRQPAQAEDMILKLSELYRGVLDSSQKQTHSLATEIKICEAYLAVEKARFGERLKSRFYIDAEVDTHLTEIPALCLQPIIENSVKHGFAHRSEGGEVAIKISQPDLDVIKVTIEDDGDGFTPTSTVPVTEHPLLKDLNVSSGTGIKNCRARLELHYGSRASFDIRNRLHGNGTIATLTLPRLEKNGFDRGLHRVECI